MKYKISSIILFKNKKENWIIKFLKKKNKKIQLCAIFVEVACHVSLGRFIMSSKIRSQSTGKEEGVDLLILNTVEFNRIYKLLKKQKQATLVNRKISERTYNLKIFSTSMIPLLFERWNEKKLSKQIKIFI